MNLGVNIDHIAVLREARLINDPSLLDALGVLKVAGADQVTIHLREDRRHINDEDVKDIIKHSALPVNLECSINEDIIQIALDLKPNRVTIVPEKREEITTEGGLDIPAIYDILYSIVNVMHDNSIEVALFIDPTIENVRSAKSMRVDWVEFHTGTYTNVYAMLNTNLRHTSHCIQKLDIPTSQLKKLLPKKLEEIKNAVDEADELGINIAAGHGLNYQNITEIAKLTKIQELNIGQSIIARSVFTGLENAIKDMKALI